MAVRPVRPRHGADRRRHRRHRLVAAWAPGPSFRAADRRRARHLAGVAVLGAVVAIVQAYGDLRNGERPAPGRLGCSRATSRRRRGARAQRRAARRRGGRSRPAVGATGPGAPGARSAPRRARRRRPRRRRPGRAGDDVRGAGQRRVAARRQRRDRRRRHRAAGATVRPTPTPPCSGCRPCSRQHARRGWWRRSAIGSTRWPTRSTSSSSRPTVPSPAVQLAPSMLGRDGPRTYFVAFTTPAEARGSAGSWARGRSCAPTTAGSRSPEPVRPAS